MTNWKLPLMGLLIYAMCLLTGCKTSNESQSPVALTWEMGATNVEPGYYENSFILKNISDKPLDKNWAIYYTQLPRSVKQEADAPVKIEVINANYFKMAPTDKFTPLAPGDSLRISFRCTFKMQKNHQAPEGTYWVGTIDGKEGKPLAVALDVRPLSSPEMLPRYPDPTKTYAANLLLADTLPLMQTDILPSVKMVTQLQGQVKWDGKVGLVFSDEFANEANLLKEKLGALYGLEVVDKAPVTIQLQPLKDKSVAVNDEYYVIHVADNKVMIAANTAHGIFNGTQTLLSMLKGQQAPYALQSVIIQDYPDLLYRGQMIDISRNFTTLDKLKKLIDIFASYKLNALHFHFSEDEAWRLEIPGLEELTTVGSRRGHTTDESTCLYPSYAGHFDADEVNSSNGYYTRREFIGLLQYAAKRHVTVIPEIESPGHARAAIVAMKARYNKYITTDPDKANEYLLSDSQDTSRYYTAQYYTDNVMNVAMPSTYRFMEKVITEVAAMYKEAGVPLASIHLGGDEVPKGVWIGSPICQKLMKEKGMTGAHDLTEYFITRLASFVKAQNLKFSGWQEVAMGHSEEGHQLLRGQTAGVYCWNTIPEWGGDQISYEIANNRYPVILCNVGNFYMDMAYDGHPDERGLDWGGTVDESKSFSMQPFNIYRSCRTNMAGGTVDMATAGKGKTTLTEEGKKYIIGVQGELFSETIRSFEWLEYYLFPKLMGLVERGWNAYPAWGALTGIPEQQAFDKALASYYEKIGDKEMPYWLKTSVNFRIPHPGLLLKEGMLYANVAYKGAQVRYTTDGTEPTAQSALWQAPVKCNAQVIKARTFYEGKESVIAILKK